MFWLFCFPYLSITCRYQLTLTAESAGIYYNRWIGAVVIVCVLQLLQLFTCWQLRPPFKFYILSYLPSFVLLTFVTHTGGAWEKIKNMEQILFYLLSVFFLVLLAGLVIRYYRQRGWSLGNYPIGSLHKWVNYNILFLFLITSATSLLTGNTETLQREMAIDYALKKKRYQRATEIGIKSDKPSVTFLQLHNYAIVRLGEMEERLFGVPQLFGTEGLFPDTTINKRCKALFVIADQLAKEDRLLTTQYIPASFLLDKDLPGFMVYGKKNGLFSIRKSIPRYYAEACLLYNKLCEESNEYSVAEIKVLPDSLSRRFELFWEMKTLNEEGDSGSVNLIRREFGDTYWWYYFYNGQRNGKKRLFKNK